MRTKNVKCRVCGKTFEMDADMLNLYIITSRFKEKSICKDCMAKKSNTLRIKLKTLYTKIYRYFKNRYFKNLDFKKTQITTGNNSQVFVSKGNMIITH